MIWRCIPLRYKIGDVSRVLGMTTSALHFYEKEGIIDTPKVDSGRRYYKEADITRLISAKKYRAMGANFMWMCTDDQIVKAGLRAMIAPIA